MTDTKPVIVCRAGDAIEAALLRGELENEGVTVFQAGGQGSLAFGEAPRDALTVDLYVPAHQLEQARRIIARHLEPPGSQEREG